MINAAHIGVGISGLEGQQAVKASDYAIGKFKFLKNLLFVHGRECYRRNSYATYYILYKNVLCCAPIFMFGFLSIFSGTKIYINLLLQFYNAVFTAVPVLWYATNDFQYSKEKLLSSPVQYKYGIRDLHFNKRLYVKEVFSALVQGAAVMFFTFFSLCQASANINGKYGGLADGGDFIFAVVIFLPSVKILVDAYQIGWGLIICVAGSVLFYMACHITISQSKIMSEEGESYQNLAKLFTFPSMYFAFVGFIFTFILLETGLSWLRRANKARDLAKIEKQIQVEKEEEMKQEGLVTIKQSEYKRK